MMRKIDLNIFYLTTILFSMKFWLRQSVLSEAHTKQEQLTQRNIIFEFIQTVEKSWTVFP